MEVIQCELCIERWSLSPLNFRRWRSADDVCASVQITEVNPFDFRTSFLRTNPSDTGVHWRNTILKLVCIIPSTLCKHQTRYASVRHSKIFRGWGSNSVSEWFPLRTRPRLNLQNQNKEKNTTESISTIPHLLQNFMAFRTDGVSQEEKALTPKPGNLSLIPGYHMVKDINWFS